MPVSLRAKLEFSKALRGSVVSFPFPKLMKNPIAVFPADILVQSKGSITLVPTATVTFNNRTAGFRVPRIQGGGSGVGGRVMALLILRKADLHLHTDPFSTVSVGAQSLRVCETGENKVSWRLPHLCHTANGCLEPQGTSAQ